MKKVVLVLFSVVCIFSMLAFVVFNFVVAPNKYESFIEKYAGDYGLESALVYAVAKTESNFDADAVSSSGARGILQLMPSTAQWVAGRLGEEYSDDLLFDAETNIRYGCFYLRYLTEKFKDVWVVVAAYNAGEGAVRDWINEDGSLDENVISYGETKRYVSKVKKYYSIYKNKEIAV